jgi:hypothetical protein
MRAFKYALLLGWAAFAVATLLLFTVPRVIIGSLGPIWLKLLMIVLLLGTGVYKLSVVYLTGMRR